MTLHPGEATFQHFFFTAQKRRDSNVCHLPGTPALYHNKNYIYRIPDPGVLQRKSHLCIPRKGIALPQFQFPHSCVCSEQFIYSQDRSHRVHIFTRDETGLVCLPTQLERTLQLYW